MADMASRHNKIRTHTTRKLVLTLAAVTPFVAAGCSHKTVQAAVPVAAPPATDVRPMTVAPDTDANPPLEADATAPSLPAPTGKAPVNLATSPVVPPPRRPTTTQSSNEEVAEQDTSHPEALRISPQLSPSDQAVYQRRFEDDSAVATKNLQIVSGRQLNPTQQDLADKIRSFLAQSTDAGKTGDWTRAQNLAQKARVLSVELINSL
jgi:hypothetical protein